MSPDTGKKRVAIACQGGGSHAAFAAGVLIGLLDCRHDEEYELVALSGTSGGAICAALAWSALVRTASRAEAAQALQAFWDDVVAYPPWDLFWNRWQVWLARLPVSMEFSPYAYPPIAGAALGSMVKKHVRLLDLPPEKRGHPALFVGVTDIKSGVGLALRGEDLTDEDLLASAAVPPLFRAVNTRGTWLWDGLFGRNPPIREFTDLHPKPNEIWVIQINPQRCAYEPTSMSQIIDRRNELTGNLSLNQELAFIDKVNDLVRENRAVKPDHAYIAIRTVELDLDLDYASKLDRGSWHIRTLIERGKAKGPDLLKPESVWSWKTRASQEAKALAAIGVRTSSRS